MSSSPFIDALGGSISWQNRVSEVLNVGLQAGVYLGGRVRLAANAMMPTSTLNDEYYGGGSNYPGSTYTYPTSSPPASFFYGASVGVVAVSAANFVLSPGVAFSRTDVSDYGSSLGVSLPFEWVTGTGLRLGLELDLGRAFGGSSHLQQCTSAGCPSGPTITQDRPGGSSIGLRFQLGLGFNHPDPLPPEPRAAPEGWLPASLPTPPAAPPTR